MCPLLAPVPSGAVQLAVHGGHGGQHLVDLVIAHI
jgi:hypothetical protein